MQLDLSFLSVPLGPAPVPVAAPVNVYDILQDAWRESRVDMTLRFFLDPGERHGLGPVMIDALLQLLDGAPTIGANGRGETVLTAEDHLGSDAWDVQTQVQYIDVYATNVETGLAVVIENKIGHELNNPLDRYAALALDDARFPTVLVVVLAPERRTAAPGQDGWLSRSITYSELGEQIKRSPVLVDHLLSPADLDQRRSLDLLQQFLEARSGGSDMTDLRAEAAQVDQWRAIQEEHQEAIQRFLDARSSVSRLIRARSRRLAPLIAEGLEREGLETGWESHSAYGAEAYNAYHFPGPDWSVELKFSADPKYPSIFVYHYPGRAYKQTTKEALGLPWTASDQDVADAFIERTKEILGDRGQRGEADTE